MKNTLFLIILLIIIAIMCDITIQLKPFILKLPSWRVGIGFILIMIGFGFISEHNRLKGYHEGLDDSVKMVQQAFDEIRKEKQDSVDKISQ